ncbi:MAG: hypothetical protein JWQ72_1900 [Polaromonas sp.]|nr:hypothetical protein [Polaromonas sp.]
MADPTVIDCASACTVTVVHELSLPPLQLDEAGGGLVAASITLCWAAGWAVRMIVRTIRDTDKTDSDE